MGWILSSMIATLLGTFFLTIIYWYVYRRYRERHLCIWAAGWTLYSVRFVFELLLQLESHVLLTLGHQIFVVLSGFLLLKGTHVFVGKKISKWIIYGTALDLLWILAGILTGFPWQVLNLPTFLFMGFINIWTGYVLLKSPEIKGLGKHMTAWAFILWGTHKTNYPFLRYLAWFAPWGYFIAATLEFIVAAGTLLIYFEKARNRLSESEQRFRLLAENARDIIYKYRLEPDMGIEYISPSVTVVTGYSPEEFYSDPTLGWKMIHPDYRHVLEKIDYYADTQRNPVTLVLIRKDGQHIWTEHTSVPFYDDRGNMVGFAGIARDITGRRLAEETAQRYQLLCKYARDIIIFFRRDGRIIEVNDAAVRSYGYTRDELLSMNVCDVWAPETRGALPGQMLVAEEEGILFETLHRRKDGTVFPVEINAQGTILGGEKVLFGIVRDITDRKKAEETINHLAFHDPLTDLPNRLLFFDRLKMAIRRAGRGNRKLAVMFLDLDRFKIVNDMMGHAAGDQLLKNVAKRLKRCVRSNDTVTRMGGDEFTILLPEINKEQDAAKVAKKILDSLRKPWIIKGYEFHVTGSIGIAVYPNDGEKMEILTKNADAAMYWAKEQGDNYRFYTPAMNEKALERMETEQALRKAMERDELEVYYQPQVNTTTGRIVGLEALVRWRNAERGFIPVCEFIPTAEDSGLIVAIDEWVLRTACRQNRKWQEAGLPPVKIAVNLSAYQFKQAQLVETIAQVLQETGLAAEFLELEITESTAMHDVDFTVSIMHKLREMGVRIAIDDFGTGYSSLGYLRRFPITTLKVDRSFVSDVLSDKEDAAIVSTIIVLAQNLNLNVIVEGVENEDQLVFFENHECYEMQGFLFSEPLPADEVENILKQPLLRSKRLLKTLAQ